MPRSILQVIVRGAWTSAFLAVTNIRQDEDNRPNMPCDGSFAHEYRQEPLQIPVAVSGTCADGNHDEGVKAVLEATVAEFSVPEVERTEGMFLSDTPADAFASAASASASPPSAASAAENDVSRPAISLPIHLGALSCRAEMKAACCRGLDGNDDGSTALEVTMRC